MDDSEVAVREAVAVGMLAQHEGVAGLSRTREQLEHAARSAIATARKATEILMREHIIPPVPTDK
jgi:hypothetical protein